MVASLIVCFLLTVVIFSIGGIISGNDREIKDIKKERNYYTTYDGYNGRDDSYEYSDDKYYD